MTIFIMIIILQMASTGMETFVWWEVPTNGKVEWRSTCLEHGALSLTLSGAVMMHKLPVASWDTSNQVA